MKLSKLESTKFRKYCFYGDAGSGKTILATSFPGKTKVFDFDLKISSAAQFFSKDKEKLDSIEVSQFKLNKKDSKVKIRPFQQFIMEFNELQDLAEKATEENPFPYDNVVIDSLTSFADFLMVEEMFVRKGKADRDTMHGVEVPNLKDYQVAIAFFKNCVMQLLTLPCNVIITAHLAYNKNELTGEVNRTLAVWGKDLPMWIPKMFEEVYYLHTKASKQNGKDTIAHFAQTRAARGFVCRSQLTNVPVHLDITKGYEELKKYF